jgi:hypothetical protein
MAPHERVAYLQEFEHSDKHDAPKSGGLIEKQAHRGAARARGARIPGRAEADGRCDAPLDALLKTGRKKQHD